MVQKFKKKDKSDQKAIYEMYLKNMKWVNNWDLVDLSAPHITGAYLLQLAQQEDRKK